MSHWNLPDVDVSVLAGRTMKSVTQYSDEAIVFETEQGEFYTMFHRQDCCENVSIEDVCGDLTDLVGSPILQAEEVSGETPPEGATEPDWSDYSHTWTFYKLATIKGSVTIRWYGTSNGYYSEGVSFVQGNAVRH